MGENVKLNGTLAALEHNTPHFPSKSIKPRKLPYMSGKEVAQMADSDNIQWYAWYFKRWDNSEFVRFLDDLEAYGAYCRLLHYQMSDGEGIPNDMEKISKILCQTNENKFKALWGRISEKWVPLTQRWVVNNDTKERDPDNGEWIPLENPPNKLHNKPLTRIMAFCIEQRKKKIFGGYKSIQKREVASLSTLIESGGAVQDVSGLDYEALWRIFPKRDNAMDGYTDGMDALQGCILNKQDYELIKHAIKNYKRDCLYTNKPKHAIMKMTTFVSRWKDWIPRELRQKADAKTAESKAEPTKKSLKDAPWTPRYGAPEFLHQEIAAAWPLERRKEWATENGVPVEEVEKEFSMARSN